MRKLFLTIIILLLNAQILFAMRQASLALSEDGQNRIKTALSIRSEIRSETLSVLDINFKDHVSAKIIESLKKSGIQIRDVQIDGSTKHLQGQKYDLIFWESSTEYLVDVHVNNLFEVLRSDGVIFIRISDEKLLQETLDGMQSLSYDVKVRGNVLIVKRKFENYKFFEFIANELAGIIGTQRSA